MVGRPWRRSDQTYETIPRIWRLGGCPKSSLCLKRGGKGFEVRRGRGNLTNFGHEEVFINILYMDANCTRIEEENPDNFEELNVLNASV